MANRDRTSRDRFVNIRYNPTIGGKKAAQCPRLSRPLSDACSEMLKKLMSRIPIHPRSFDSLVDLFNIFFYSKTMMKRSKQYKKHNRYNNSSCRVNMSLLPMFSKKMRRGIFLPYVSNMKEDLFTYE